MKTNYEKVNWIKARLAEGRTVLVTTYLKQIRYSAKHADMFRATENGTFVQHGKNWLCIDGAKISAV